MRSHFNAAHFFSSSIGKQIMKTTEERFWEKVDKTTGHGPNGDCWIWIGAVNDSGYGKLNANGSQAYRAHRFSYELIHGRLPKEVCVLHRCDVRRCVRPDHLFEGDRAINNKDTASKGRAKGGASKGSAHPRAILDERTVEYIWYLHELDLGATQIARILGHKRSTIKNVLSGTNWLHVYTKAA
jgi:hypothetical protein